MDLAVDSLEAFVSSGNLGEPTGLSLSLRVFGWIVFREVRRVGHLVQVPKDSRLAADCADVRLGTVLLKFDPFVASPADGEHRVDLVAGEGSDAVVPVVDLRGLLAAAQAEVIVTGQHTLADLSPEGRVQVLVVRVREVKVSQSPVPLAVRLERIR